MTNDDRDLDRAILLYLGYGSQSAPVRDRESLQAEFGPYRANALERAVAELVEEISAFQPDWSRDSLISAGRLAGELMRSRHPELSDEAVAALEWKYMWDWR